MTIEKKVILKFELTQAQESTIRSFINRSIINKQVEVVQGLTQLREDVRIKIKDLQVSITTQQTERLPSRTFDAFVVDLSSGGMCIAINPDVKLVKNSLATVNMDFIERGLIVTGTILGLAKQA